MPVWSISFKYLLPEWREGGIGELVSLADWLHLFSELLTKHLLQAVLYDIVSGVERYSTASSPFRRSSWNWLLWPYCALSKAIWVSILGRNIMRLDRSSLAGRVLLCKIWGSHSSDCISVKRFKLKCLLCIYWRRYGFNNWGRNVGDCVDELFG